MRRGRDDVKEGAGGRQLMRSCKFRLRTTARLLSRTKEEERKRIGSVVRMRKTSLWPQVSASNEVSHDVPTDFTCNASTADTTRAINYVGASCGAKIHVTAHREQRHAL